MSGQCYGCGTEFSFFKKEHGCKNCGFAFCSNCLPKKIAVPKLDNTKHHVCNRCFDILTGKKQPEDTGRHSPPAAYIKRMAALKEQESQPRGKPKSQAPAAKSHVSYAGLSKKDREIAERLQKLKEKPQEQAVSEKEINERLARLKGEDPAVRTAPTKPAYQPPDRRTQIEQIDDLLDEIANEVEIDSRYPDPATDVENRLAQLRKAETGASQDEHKNLDKNDLSPQKNFVKNIDVSAGSSRNIAAGNSSQATGDSDVDFAEVQDLMARAARQMEQEAQQALEGMKKDKQLMERLAELKQRQKDKEGAAKSDERSLDSNVDNAAVDDDDDSENEEEAAKRIMQRFLEEVKLDEKAGDALSTGSEASSESSRKAEKSKAKQTNQPKKKTKGKEKDDDDDEYEDPDELPFCCICTEDAVIRCRDCDMDLYCDRCFRDGHKELGLMNHLTSPYKAPKGYR